jgi:ubiquinone/menaquinone biosynthesis C-methylase UbiE
VVANEPDQDLLEHRRSLWDYYDRRVTGRLPGLVNAYDYWTGRGVHVQIEDIASEATQVEGELRELRPESFVDVGAGPGTFTGSLQGTGIALDQSRRALAALRGMAPNVPVVQADALRLPLPDRAVTRFFSAHLYGLLLPSERQDLLAEAHRVAAEVVIVDAGHPMGVRSEEWQERTLPDGGCFKVFRRHFGPEVLAAELGGDVLLGQFYVLVRVRQGGR